MTDPTVESRSSVTIGRVPTGVDLARFAESAVRDDRRLVVGALIVDGARRIYVQKRSQTRELFPGAWDIVGGHVEAGETVEAALAREVMEETGWTLTGLGAVVEVIDWEAGGVRRREVDMLVSVEGDLDDPLLEAGKHSEGRWLESDEAHLLLESRSPTDVWVHTVVVRAFVMASRVAD
jgi:8-oxo-dGTP pyrophosphatase MutT (NUDIX family)